jgi:uncharacterized DUF497 family protein
LEITFDPIKRDKVLAERGLDFAHAGRVFAGRTATARDIRKSYPEARFITAGLLGDRVVVMVWTPTAAGRRIISMRHCHEDEARRWREQMG